MASEDRFGYEWNKYSEIDPNYEIQFLRWVKPLTPSDFKDKVILDAGCGTGRNSYWLLKYGAQKVVAFDYDSRSVEVACRNLAEFGDRAEILFQSIYKISWRDEFDIVFCIGVVHHLENPKLAIENLIRAVKPQGRLLIWVYSLEGNERWLRFVDSFRKYLTSRLPVGFVHFLSYFVSVPLYLFLRIFKARGEYLKQLSQFHFRHVHSIIFDQLIPKIANYWRKDEALAMLNLPGLSEVQILRPDNHQGWIVTGIKIKKTEV